MAPAVSPAGAASAGTRPVLYLDVDGAVSALSPAHGFGDGLAFDLFGDELVLSERLGAHLGALDADLRWLTTWGADANLIAAAMDLPDLPVAGLPPMDAAAGGPWKFEVVRGQVDLERRPFVWIDDEAIPLETEAWAASIGVPCLLIEPDPDRGLTPADLDAVEAFIGR